MQRIDRLKLLVVLPSATRGGAEINLERLCAATTRIDLRIAVLADGDAAQVWRERGYPVTVIDAGQGRRALAGAIAPLAREMRRSRPDVVMGIGVKTGLAASVAGIATGVRSCWMRVDDSFPGLWTRLTDRLTDGQISTPFLLRGRRVPQALTLDPVADPRSVPRDQARRELGMAEDEKHHVVMASRLIPYKGIDDAIVALADPRVADWNLHVYGMPDADHPAQQEELRTIARRTGVDDRVHLRAPRDDIGSLMAAFDAAAVLTKPLPGSHVSTESFSMVALEAMNAGTPVISIPPVSDRVGSHGVGVRPATPADVTAALHTIAGQKATGDRLVAAAGTSPSEAADRWVSYLSTLCANPGAGLQGDGPISVITTTLNDGAALRSLATALLPCLGPDDEWVVADASSTDGSQEFLAELARQDRRVTVLVEPGAGISRGRNLAVAASRHPLIAATDAGCVPTPGWLDAFRAAARDRPDAGLLTGTYTVTATGPLQHALVACGYPDTGELAHPSLLVRAYGRVLGRVFDASMPTGRSMAFRRQAWEQVGGFPVDLATGEDVSFGRAIAARWPVALVRAAEVSWAQRDTMAQTMRMYYSYGAGSSHSRDPRLLGRDLVRAAVYPAGIAAGVFGSGRLRLATAAAAATYLSLPMARAARSPHPLAVTALVPVVSAARDLAKAAGAIRAWRG